MTKPSGTIDLVPNVFANHPEIYCALSRLVSPARRTGNLAESKGWGLYILIAALSQVQPWAREACALVDAAWMLTTLATLFAVVAAFRDFPRYISDALGKIRIYLFLVIWLWPDQVLRPTRQPRISSRITGNADPARPLQLRI